MSEVATLAVRPDGDLVPVGDADDLLYLLCRLGLHDRSSGVSLIARDPVLVLELVDLRTLDMDGVLSDDRHEPADHLVREGGQINSDFPHRCLISPATGRTVAASPEAQRCVTGSSPVTYRLVSGCRTVSRVADRVNALA